jgi:hypothetical protein
LAARGAREEFAATVETRFGSVTTARSREAGSALLKRRVFMGRLQARVELLHKKWNIKNRFMDPPSFGKLVSMDPGLIVKPPKGYEVGYVPIVIRQGWPKTGGSR